MTPHPQGNGKPGDVAESEREKFEAAMEGEELDFTLYTLPGCENSYSSSQTQLAYFAWRQGRDAATAIPPGFKVVPDASDEWFCEQHPESPMGHDGCTGAGIPECARIHMLLNKLRLAEQETRETAMVRDDLAACIRAMPSAAPVPEAGQGLDRQRNQEIAELLLDNDREGSMKWARGIHVTWKEDGWEVSAPLVSHYAAVFDAVGIGSDVRTPRLLLANVENLLRRTACLDAIEREFFMVQTPPDPDEGDDEPGEECLLNWGHDPAQYVEQFREALKSASPPPQSAQLIEPVPDAVWEALQRLIENAASLGPASQEDAIAVARWRGQFVAAREGLMEGKDAVRWISVSERMPEPETECLIWRHPSYAKQPFAMVDRWGEQHESPVGWSSASIPIGLGWDDAAFEEVTYWAPITPPAALSQGQQTEQGGA